MTQQGDDHSRGVTGEEPGILNYARPGTAKAPRGIPISGMVSFAAMCLQIPWAIVVFDFDWANETPRGMTGPVSPIGEILIGLMLFLPTLLGLVYGFHSARVAGITSRNTFGVLGLVMVAVVALLVIWGNSFAVFFLPSTSEDIINVLQFPILVLLLATVSIIVWRVAKSRRRR